ncbi:MAG: AbrB/MazE/SpoVT family DNA-binding domain-containing protein [Panacagrimonas sp.]
MLSKLTSKNQLTLPKAVISQFPGTEYFEVSADGGRIVLTPLRKSRIEEVWRKIEKLGITEQDIEDAVQWARNKP